MEFKTAKVYREDWAWPKRHRQEGTIADVVHMLIEHYRQFRKEQVEDLYSWKK